MIINVIIKTEGNWLIIDDYINTSSRSNFLLFAVFGWRRGQLNICCIWSPDGCWVGCTDLVCGWAHTWCPFRPLILISCLSIDRLPLNLTEELADHQMLSKIVIWLHGRSPGACSQRLTAVGGCTREDAGCMAMIRLRDGWCIHIIFLCLPRCVCAVYPRVRRSVPVLSAGVWVVLMLKFPGARVRGQ